MIDGNYLYHSQDVKALIDPETFQITKVEFLTKQPKTVTFSSAATMSIILHGALQLDFDTHI